MTEQEFLAAVKAAFGLVPHGPVWNNGDSLSATYIVLTEDENDDGIGIEYDFIAEEKNGWKIERDVRISHPDKKLEYNSHVAPV
jgi:hypothetical protein